jgi:predicted nuclease of restriction endonuclease-like (RecB) superfamily
MGRCTKYLPRRPQGGRIEPAGRHAVDREGVNMSDNSRQPPATTEATIVAADTLFQRVVEIVSGAQGRVARAVDTTMVQAYWEIGRQIVLVEQQGGMRAEYGEQVLVHLSTRLGERFGKGFSVPHLKRMRQFFRVYASKGIQSELPGENDFQQIGSTLWSQLAPGVQPHFRQELSWSHFRLLMGVSDASARSFYELEAATQGWSVRELERQIASHLYERLAASRDKDDVLALAHKGQELLTPQDVIKDPVVLEFLGLPERPQWRERDLEQAIIDHLQEFMLELGKGFCFIARQKRITLDGDHFFVDLVLYNRLLRCFVVIDLKLGKLTHRDLGQVQMYVNWFDRTQREAYEEPTIGIALCSRKNDAVVRMTLPEGENRIVAARYEMVMPTPEQIEQAVLDGRRAAERRN